MKLAAVATDVLGVSGRAILTRQNTAPLQLRLIRRLGALGLRVTVEPVAQAA